MKRGMTVLVVLHPNRHPGSLRVRDDSEETEPSSPSFPAKAGTQRSSSAAPAALGPRLRGERESWFKAEATKKPRPETGAAHYSARHALKRNIVVLLPGIGEFLVAQGAQGLDQAMAGAVGLDHVIEEAA